MKSMREASIQCTYERSYLELIVSYGWLADLSIFVLRGEGFVVI